MSGVSTVAGVVYSIPENGLARWERANGMLGAKRDALRVQAMMVDATTGGAEGE